MNLALSTEHLLEKKVQYFLRTKYRKRGDAHSVLKSLQKHGRLVLVGGMLRDIALFGNAGFRSDVDLVISPYDLKNFECYMAEVGARPNRFGGYSLPARRWQVDVWPLQKTWAHVEGHVKVKTIGDLRHVTFFKSDAILYDFEYRRLLTCRGYFDYLNERILDINLRPNPNPKGNAVRALRYAVIKGFRWGPELSRFVSETIDSVGWSALLDAERRSFRSTYLASLRYIELKRELDLYVSDADDAPFDLFPFRRYVQLELPHLN